MKLVATSTIPFLNVLRVEAVAVAREALYPRTAASLGATFTYYIAFGFVLGIAFKYFRHLLLQSLQVAVQGIQLEP